MNSRQRFRATMRYEAVDRLPYFEEPLREEVIEAWHSQGLPPGTDPVQMFPADRHELLEPDLEPRPGPAVWPTALTQIDSFRRLLDPNDPDRLPENWPELARQCRSHDHVVMLGVHKGLFLTMGVRAWQRFDEVIRLLGEEPRFVQKVMAIQGEFAAAIAEKVLREVEVDAAIFSEPISDNRGSLISPRMYEDLVLESYDPILDLLRRYRVETVVFMTYANTRLLLPSVLKRGFNCLWAHEVNIKAMDYRDLRREYGRDLRLIGGIDLDALRSGREAIKREIMDKVPMLLEDGGYVPLADGRVRQDVPYENYVYFRQLLEDVTGRRSPEK
jgi:hypothetical protein